MLKRALKDLESKDCLALLLLYPLCYALQAPHFRQREREVIKLINILVIDFNIFTWVIILCYICLFVCNFRLCIHSGVVGQQLVCTHAQNCSIAS